MQRNEDRALLSILDEPTTGLHFDDVALLVKVFARLVEQGNSLLVIEHNLEVIKSADYVLDLGPGSGSGRRLGGGGRDAGKSRRREEIPHRPVSPSDAESRRSAEEKAALADGKIPPR